MKVRLNGQDAVLAASRLLRAGEAALQTLPDPPPYTRAQKRMIAPRFASLVAGTRALEGRIVDGVAAMRDGFFGRLGWAREADGDHTDDAELARFLAAVDAMSPTALERALGQAYEDLYLQGVRHVQAEMTDSFNLQPTRAIAALDRTGMDFVEDILGDEKTTLKNLIREAFKAGLELPELERDIRLHFSEGIHRIADDGSERVIDLDAWARAVARTETARAQNQGSLDGYEAAGVEKIIWVTGNDERVCPICRPLDGRVAMRGENFPGTDVQAGPIHVNCRCTIVGLNAITQGLVRA